MKKILLISGSARKKGTSQSISDYLEKVFTKQGCQVSKAPAIELFDKKVPLISIYEQGKELFKEKELFAIGHGGMPYNDVHENCINTCRCFNEKMEIEIGWLGKKLVKGLDLLAEDIISDRHISKQVQKYFNITIPSFFNPFMVWFLNGIAAKDRKEKGVVDFDRKVY